MCGAFSWHIGWATWEQIARHAQDDYPSECCGIVTRYPDGNCRVHRCENIQDRLHAHDTKAHPRDSRTAYRMDDLQVGRILRETEAQGGCLVGFYHSHIDCDAYFSSEDRAAATFWGEPVYAGVVYLVVSVVDGRVCGQKGFQWDDGTRAFVEVILTVGPAR